MDVPQETTARNFVRAILEGGPQSLPNESRSLLIDPDEKKIKIPYYGGYEHFERTAEPSRGESLLFVWKTRTKVAE